MVMAVREPEYPLGYSPQVREYSLCILDGGESGLLLSVCPFCGAQLPLSLRSRWIERLEAIGLDLGAEKIPPDLSSDSWWRSEQLAAEYGDP
jgi:hypothetical protein